MVYSYWLQVCVSVHIQVNSLVIRRNKSYFLKNDVDVKQISIALSLLRDTHPVVRDDGETLGKGRRGQNKKFWGKNSHKSLHRC